MPFSSVRGKKESYDFIKENFKKGSFILDVGAGEGTYFKLLKDLEYVMDAIEVWQPYIDKYNLRSIYRNVFNEDVVKFSTENMYDLVIMGDVLEHLTIVDAITTLETMKKIGKCILISVPYMSRQGAWRGVESERHRQSDLNHETFNKRYEGFERLWTDNKMAVYIWKAK